MTYLASLQKTYYEVLGVGPKADTSEIKSAYRHKLLTTHPDKAGTEIPVDIAAIKQAYEALVEPTSRAEYDESLVKTSQRHGFNINGDGLDTFGLQDFESDEIADVYHWYKDCPRCHGVHGIELTETDLEEHGTDDGSGGFDIIVQCSSCSLWIKVKYYEE